MHHKSFSSGADAEPALPPQVLRISSMQPCPLPANFSGQHPLSGACRGVPASSLQG